MSQASTEPTTATEPGGRRPAKLGWAVAICIALVAGVAIIYGQTLRDGFILLDDFIYVASEPHVTGGLSWPAVVWAFAKGPVGDWCPLAMLSHMLDCQIFGLNPAGHHFSNVALHALSSVILFLVLWRMTLQRAVPGTDRRLVAAQASGVRVASAGPSAETQQAVPGTDRRLVVAQASGVRVAPAGPSAETQQAVPGTDRRLVVAQASGVRVAPAGPSAETLLWPCAMVAALFAVHPLHVESVAWIAERRDVLSGLCFMLTLGAYGEYVRRPDSWLRYLAVVGVFILGLLAKPILVTLPPLLLLLDYWPLGRFASARATETENGQPTSFPWRLVWGKLPLLALALATAGITVITHHVDGPSPVVSLPVRLGNAAVSCVAYLGQLFVPVDLSIFYGYPEAGRPIWQVAAAVALLLAITSAAVLARRSYPYLFVGWFWYLGMLLPVSEIVPVGAHARADRYTYLTQIGLYIALVWGAIALTAAWPARRWLLGFGSCLVLAALTASAWRQTGYWQNDALLWRHALACDPKSATAHYYMALALKETDLAAGMAQLRQAIELPAGEQNYYYGMRAQAYVALGDIANREGNDAEAQDYLEQALVAYPKYAQAHAMLGCLQVNQGKFDSALAHLRRCVELEPHNPADYCNLALGLDHAGRPDEAIAVYRRAIEVDPNSATARSELATALVKRGDLDEAILQLRRAIELEPDALDTYRELTRLLRQQGSESAAAEIEKRANQAGRRYANTQNQRGLDLFHEGHLDEAIACFQAAIEAVSDDAQLHCNLAQALVRQDKKEEAITEYLIALSIDPNLPTAKSGLEQLSGR